MFIGTEGGQGVRRSKEKTKDLILTLIQKEFIDLEGDALIGLLSFQKSFWNSCQKKKTKNFSSKLLKYERCRSTAVLKQTCWLQCWMKETSVPVGYQSTVSSCQSWCISASICPRVTAITREWEDPAQHMFFISSLSSPHLYTHKCKRNALTEMDAIPRTDISKYSSDSTSQLSPCSI